MTIELPKAVSAYYEADKNNKGAVSDCFTEDAVVVDEKNTYSGRAAIQKWKEESATKYTYTAEPFAVEDVTGKIVVTARLTGNFPGSPLNLRYFFGVEGGKIAHLEIKL